MEVPPLPAYCKFFYREGNDNEFAWDLGGDSSKQTFLKILGEVTIRDFLHYFRPKTSSKTFWADISCTIDCAYDIWATQEGAIWATFYKTWVHEPTRPTTFIGCFSWMSIVNFVACIKDTKSTTQSTDSGGDGQDNRNGCREIQNGPEKYYLYRIEPATVRFLGEYMTKDN